MNIKSVGKNTIYYAVGIIFIRLTTFLLIPLYTNFLTQKEYGLLATLLFTTEIIITINDLGMRSAFMRFYSDYLKKNKVAELIGSSVFINILIGVFLLLIAFFIDDSTISKLFKIEILPHIVFLTLLAGIVKSLSLNILSYFRVKNLGGSYLIISVGSSILLIIITWLAIAEYKLGIIGVLYSQILSFGLTWFVILIYISSKEGFEVKVNSVLKLSKFGYPLIFATSGTILINTFGNYFLGIFRSLEEVAIFAIAYKIASISVMVLIAPFQLAFEPYIFNNKSNPDLKGIISKSITFITLVFLVISLGILFLFKYLIQFIGSEEYLKSYPLVFVLLPGFLFVAFSYIGQGLIHLNNKTKTTGSVSLIVTLISIAISYFATIEFGIYGTMCGVLFSLISSGVLLLYLGNKEYKLQIEYKRISIIFILGSILFIILLELSVLDNVQYFIVSLILFIVTTYVFYKSSFFDDSEKQTILLMISKIKEKLKLSY